MPFIILVIDSTHSAVFQIGAHNNVKRKREFNPHLVDHLLSICALEEPDLIIFNSLELDISVDDFLRRIAVLCRPKSAPSVLVGPLSQQVDNGSGSATDSLQKVAFSIDELLKFLSAEHRPTVLSGQGICLNPTTKEVTRFGRRVTLDPTELRLLQTLMELRGQTLRREELADKISGCDDTIDARSVDVYVGRLRKALVRGREISPIRTVRGLGYCFEA